MGQWAGWGADKKGERSWFGNEGNVKRGSLKLYHQGLTIRQEIAIAEAPIVAACCLDNVGDISVPGTLFLLNVNLFESTALSFFLHPPCVVDGKCEAVPSVEAGRATVAGETHLFFLFFFIFIFF